MLAGITEIKVLASLVKELLYLRDTYRAGRLDRKQRGKYGPNTPKYAERIWVDSNQCKAAVYHSISRRKSGLVMGGDWDQNLRAITENPKIRYCLAHWQTGLSWQDAGAYEYMLTLIKQKSGPVDGVANLSEIKDRYAKLDTIYAQTQKDGGLKTAQTVKGKNFRESGGILIHIDRHAAPLFGNAGHHRLAIALALGFSHFPAQLGVVHPDALSALENYRAAPKGVK